MGSWGHRTAAADSAELLDDPALSPEESERSLNELDRVNRALLGAVPLVRTVLPRLGRSPRRRRVLDVGTGTGLVAARLARAAARHGAPLAVVGLDRKLSHLLAGRRAGVRQLRVVGDATALPFRDGAFEWAFSTLFFHHFDAEGNRAVLAGMRRVARAGAAVVDLRRHPLLSLGVRLLVPLLGAGRVTRVDGRVSAARAWTVPEVAALVEGEPVLELRRRFPFRFSLVLPGGATPLPGGL